MLMISAIVRPEKVAEVMAALMYAGFPSVTKMDVYGRGKQRGIKVGEVNYDELPKELLFTVVKNDDRKFVVDTIMKAARTGHKGAFGDGKIFIQAVEESITVSSGERESEPPLPAPVVDAA